MDHHFVDCWVNTELLAIYKFDNESDADASVELAKQALALEGRAHAPFSGVKFIVRRDWTCAPEPPRHIS